MENPRLHEFISDYIDGNMDTDMRIVFEDFLNKNEMVRRFVQTALQGRKTLVQYGRMSEASPAKKQLFQRISSKIIPMTVTAVLGSMFMVALTS